MKQVNSWLKNENKDDNLHKLVEFFLNVYGPTDEVSYKADII